MTTEKNVLMFTIVAAAVGLLSVAALEIALIGQEQQQQVDAKGCKDNSVGFNGSQGRCFKG